MSGTVLIVEGLATNRIVLKVKLSAAYFSVAQAGSAADALALIARDRPQAVLLSDDLPDASARDLTRDIRALPGCARMAVLVLTDSADTAERLALLRAGASDVLAKPYSEQVLLARLRSLARHAAVEADLQINSSTAQALGFAEAQAGFAPRGLIGALNNGTPGGQALCRRLAQDTGHRVEPFRMGQTGLMTGLSGPPDVLLVSLPPCTGEHDLFRLAELGSAPQTRKARMLVLLEDTNTALATKVLDMGAHDIASLDADPREIALRLEALLCSKQADDMQKARLRTGLLAAVTDPLTGLYNRRYALSQMQRLIDAARHGQQPFAVMVADLDHFKTVNDTYGHAAGDQVLTQVAHTLRDALRPGDCLARIGGEEFLVLMPQSDKKSARAMARHLCRSVRETPVVLAGADVSLALTVSIGATVADPAQRGDALDPEALVAEADHALYAAKSDGRDTVTMARLSAA